MANRPSKSLPVNVENTDIVLSRLCDIDATLPYLESQIYRSLALQSPFEHQYWCKPM